MTEFIDGAVIAHFWRARQQLSSKKWFLEPTILQRRFIGETRCQTQIAVFAMERPHESSG
jgi:hypothetical protein